MTASRAVQLLWVLIFGTALLVRAPSLIGRSFWLDEIITRNTARLPLFAPGAFHTSQGATHSIVGFCLHDSGPGPLTYMLEGAFTGFAEVGGNEFWLRIPGIVSSLLLLLLTWKRGRAWCGGQAGALTLGSFVAVYPEVVDWSTGARGYGWSFLWAFLQLDLLTRLAGKSARCARQVWALFCILTCVGILFHAIHIIWSGTLVLSAMILFLGKKQSALKRLGVTAFSAGIAAVIIAHLVWLVSWRTALGQSPTPFAAAITFGEIPAAVRRMAVQLVEHPGISIILLWSIFSGALFLARGSRIPTALRMIIPLTAVLSLALWLLLTLRLFTAPRYFYAATAAAAWMAAIAVQNLWQWLHLKNPVAANLARFGIPLTIAFACIKPAASTAGTPVHNWAAAAAWLKTRSLPTDVLVCGPNSDQEAFVPYATTLGVPGTPIRFVTDSARQPFDAYTEPGMRTLLESGKRAWFVTPFFGLHRTPGYWKLVAGNFRVAAKIPGKGEIVILLHDGRR